MKATVRFLCVSTLTAFCVAWGNGGGSSQQPPPLPGQPQAAVEGKTKQLFFSWVDVDGADYYRLMENADGHSNFNQVGENIPADTLIVTRHIAVHLVDFVNAQYIIEACNVSGCASPDVVTVMDAMLDTIGYFKALNTGEDGRFHLVALSADGNTLAVGASSEESKFMPGSLASSRMTGH